jgi:uncharacterized phage infection (PIP) family protein YhgE
VDAIKTMANDLQSLAGIGSTTESLYNKMFVDPLKNSLDDMDKQIADQQKVMDWLNTGVSDPELAKSTAANLADLEAKRAKSAQDYADAQEKATKLQEMQQKISFVEEQMKLIDMIKSSGLDAKTLLGGVTLGMNADPGQVLTAIENAMNAMVNKITGGNSSITANFFGQTGSPDGVVDRLGSLAAGLG